MTAHNPKNERIKRQYFVYLREAERYSESSVDGVASALARFERFNRHRGFEKFHHQQAVAFKHALAQQESEATGQKLSKATQYATLSRLKRFFHWLAGQPGYKSSLRYSDANYFNLPEKESRIATTRRTRIAPTLQQIKHAISIMPVNTDIEKRDRALMAFTILTGARDGAIASLKLKHVDLAARCVHQDARDVKTKFSKTFSTFFFPVGEDIDQIIIDWLDFLRERFEWGNEDPLFPSTKVSLGPSGLFVASGIDREHWRNATPIRNVFKRAFAAAGLPYFNPHSFRNTLVALGLEMCHSPEAFKAWSQNLGHEGVLTTFTSYGTVATIRQAEIIRGMVNSGQNFPQDWETMLRRLQHPDVVRVLTAKVHGPA